MNEESGLAQKYLSATDALSEAVTHDSPSTAAATEQCLALYKELDEKIEDTGDQLEQSAKQTESGANQKAARATRAIFSICGISLLILFLGSFALVRTITHSLQRLTLMIQDIAEGEGDVTKRLEMAGGASHDELGEVSRLFNLFMDKLQELLRGVAAHTHKLTTASQQLLEASEQITVNSGETAVQSNSVSRVTQQVTQNLQSLSTGAGEMTLDYSEHCCEHQGGCQSSGLGRQRAQAANATVTKLGQSSAEIGDSHQGHHLDRAADQFAGLECNH